MTKLKHPKYNKKPLDKLSRERMREMYVTALIQISFDNETNNLGLTNKDEELLARNVATRILF